MGLIDRAQLKRSLDKLEDSNKKIYRLKHGEQKCGKQERAYNTYETG